MNIRVGQILRIYGRTYKVLRRERGRAGEERTMYVIGLQDASGEWHARETRGRSVVLRLMEGEPK